MVNARARFGVRVMVSFRFMAGATSRASVTVRLLIGPGRGLR